MLVARRSPRDGEASSASGIGLTPGAFDMAGLVRGSTERVATRTLTLGHVPPTGARWSSLRQGLYNGPGNRITAAQASEVRTGKLSGASEGVLVSSPAGRDIQSPVPAEARSALASAALITHDMT
jgi:hypothetical protein